jgi:CRP-like cAMP-binding protein/uncharacterized protein (DUF2225 family)
MKIEELLKIATVKQFVAGGVISAEGDAADDMFIILKGSAGIYKNYRLAAERRENTLKTGDFFGEMSLFLGNRHTVTAAAEEDTVVLNIGRINARQVFSSEPDITMFIMETLFDRINRAAADYEELAAKVGDAAKPPIKEYSFNVNNPQGECLSLHKKGDVLSEGEAKNRYLLLSGKARLYFNFGKVGETPLSELTAGNFFGESLLGSVTAVASEDVLLLVMNNKIRAFFANEPEATFHIMEVLCDRLNILLTLYESFFSGKLTTEGYRAHILFPDGHKVYEAGINRRSPALFQHYLACPICKKKFPALYVQMKGLSPVSTDDDFRVRYKEADPLYYEAITCPQCWFSAPEEYFNLAAYPAAFFEEKLAPYKAQIRFSFQQDINSVFNSYYLATVSVPLCYTGSHLIMGHVWQRIGWLYDDCGDAPLRDMAYRYSLNYFRSAYSAGVPLKQLSAVMIIIGVLSRKLGNTADARLYLKKVINMKGVPENYKAKASELLLLYESGL